MRDFVFFVFLIFCITDSATLFAQRWKSAGKNNDTITFSSTQILITKDTVYFSPKDSFVVLKRGKKYRIRRNPYTKSEVFYDSLRVKSYRSKVTEELYHLVFKTVPIEIHDTSNFDKSENVFVKYQGLTIKSIRLKKIDIIEGSIYDTLIVASSFVGRSANNIHTNTSTRIILNNLTFKNGDIIDANQLADNERILRSAPYIEDARIFVIPDSLDKTMANILILTKDEFSVGIGSDYSSVDNFALTLYDKNFLGIGHDMRHSMIFKSGYKPQYGYNFRYSVNNIAKSFISARVEYESSWERDLKMINFNKAFLSPETKYAGGVALYEISDERQYTYTDTIVEVPYKAVLQDYWIGHALPIRYDNRARINISFRYSKSKFVNRPVVSPDSNFFFHDRSLYLAELSLVNRSFYKSSLVLGFGITEDVPYGYIIKATAGFDKDEFANRLYLGGGIAYAKHYQFPGYLLASFSMGSFYNRGTLQDGVIKFELSNIGNLHRLNRYSVRNFANLKFEYGINQTDPDSKANLNNRWTAIVSGLNREALKGNQKLSLSLESTLFTPWYLLGFKFSIFAFSDMGWVSSENKFGRNLSYYASLGGGLRIKNESWIFETITLGFAFFASAPESFGRTGFIFDASDPRLFRNLEPDRPEVIRMDQNPQLFID